MSIVCTCVKCGKFESHPFFVYLPNLNKNAGQLVSERPDPEKLAMGPLKYMTEDEHAGKKICHFLANYVVKIYGVKSVGDWLRNNKEMTFLDMMSMDNVAY